MAVLLLALFELDVDRKLKIVFLCKENTGTRAFAALLQWLDLPVGVLNRIGRLVVTQSAISPVTPAAPLTSTQRKGGLL